jgi:hypothetical protein
MHRQQTATRILKIRMVAFGFMMQVSLGYRLRVAYYMLRVFLILK